MAAVTRNPVKGGWQIKIDFNDAFVRIAYRTCTEHHVRKS